MYQISVYRRNGDLRIKYGKNKYVVGSNGNLYLSNGDQNADNTSLPRSERHMIVHICLSEVLKKDKDKRSKSERDLIEIVQNN